MANRHHAETPAKLFRKRGAYRFYVLYIALACILSAVSLNAQMDQGTITGTVLDTTGAVIPSADVTLSSTDTGLALHAKSDGTGGFVFSPIKIGNYKLSASAPGMQTTTRQNIHVDIQQRLSLDIRLQPGATNETVTVDAAPPLMQTQQSSVGQVISTSTINNLPLNGRNWVYIAQLGAGVTPTGGSRGGGTGDFNANGQRAQQNNFILDGVDDNINVVDFMNGASYVVRPPPDALAEFKVDTGDYSAEFGHSAGAVMNVSLKAGTNAIHGSLWEYVRNDALDARNWNATSNPKYRQNQFGATLGMPIIHNKLFFFGDAEADRIIFAETNVETVPTSLIRQGNFSELLNPSLTQSGKAIALYQPNSSGTAPLTCGANQNTFCAGQMDSLALRLLNLFPMPNTNGSKVFNNYVVNRNVRDNTFQWDTRMDWNISEKDQAFARFSYTHEPQFRPPPLGPILDGGKFQDDGNMINLGENFAFSETHVFSPTLVNEFRFGYNYGNFAFLQPNYNTDFASSLGLGGVPYSSSLQTGGLPTFNVNGVSTFGTIGYLPTKEGENVYQFLDNLTRIAGKHSLKFGVNFQSIRFRTLQVAAALGSYTYNGLYTSNLGAANTGNGVADFLANQMNTASVSTLSQFNDVRWYRNAYFQDDWRITQKFTLNMGVRYEYVEPIRENTGRQANFVPTPTGPGTGTGLYVIPTRQRGAQLSSNFTNLLAKDNIALQYSDNLNLINAQKGNFAPRIGLSYAFASKMVLRAGFGMFYGGLENRGGATNLGNNYPFQFTSSFPASSCKASSCV
ncbi:MAG TPA: carboxypeptidase regulatory-like domain-containing protein, partial [Acidobacteriaceae bacterium]|nr:carboxypeptidase regulatory-like domain-containing protein [Acidobacteriaceae bacterium]